MARSFVVVEAALLEQENLDMDMWTAIAAERRRLADDLDSLTPEQWATQSQCDAWDVHHAAAHVVMPFRGSTPKMLLGVITSGFSLDKYITKTTAALAAELSHEQVVQDLRDNAENRWTPPGPFGPEIPLTEILVHSQDIRNPLGLGCPIPDETIDTALAAIKKDKIREDYRARIAG